MIKETQALSVRAVVQVEMCWCQDDFDTEEEWLDFKTSCQTAGDFARERLLENLDGGQIEGDVITQIEDESAKIKVLEGVYNYPGERFVFEREIQFTKLPVEGE